MSTLIPCPQCRTAKKYAPLGGILKACDKCDSIGYIKEPTLTPKTIIKEALTIIDESLSPSTAIIVDGDDIPKDELEKLYKNPIAKQLKTKMSKSQAKRVKAQSETLTKA